MSENHPYHHHPPRPPESTTYVRIHQTRHDDQVTQRVERVQLLVVVVGRALQDVLEHARDLPATHVPLDRGRGRREVLLWLWL